MPDADYHYACDTAWWDRYYDDVKAGFRGVSYTIDCVESPARNPNHKFDLVRLPAKHGEGLSKEFIHYGIRGGGNSGYQAVNLAYQLGAKRIVLLGFDMFGTHFFGDHPVGLGRDSPFKLFIESFETITSEVEIINCTRRSALNCFPKMSLELVL